MGCSADNVLVNSDKRLFFLSDNIDNATIGKICFNLLYILQEDEAEESLKKDYERKPVRIFINSDGGSVYDMWGLVDIIEHSKTPIYTYCNGYAMSAAFTIFLAGHKRYATRHSTFLYHQMSGWRSGKYQDLVEDREEMDFLQSSIENYVAERCSIGLEQLEEYRLTKKDVYIHANSAVELGIIDEVI